MLYINGEAVQREPAGEWEGEGRFGSDSAIQQYRETLPNGVSYITLDMIDERRRATTPASSRCRPTTIS